MEEKQDKIINLLTDIKSLLRRQEIRTLRDAEWIEQMKRITKQQDPNREE